MNAKIIAIFSNSSVFEQFEKAMKFIYIEFDIASFSIIFLVKLNYTFRRLREC